VKAYFLLAVVVLSLGIAGGVGLGSWTTNGNHFTPSNLENPLPDLGSDQLPPGVEPEARRARAVVVNGERFNFGSMRRKEEMQHTFYIRNTGNAPLRIEKRETTCTCTLSRLEKGEIPPNDTVGVTLEWTAKGESDNFKQSAIIATNDPEREFIQLRIEGMVENTIFVDPPSVQFVNISANEPATREFRIYGSKSLESLGVANWELMQKGTAEFFDVQMREMKPEEFAEEKTASHAILVTVTVKPGLPSGDIIQTIRLEMTMKDAPEFLVDVGGNIVGDISIIGPKYDSNRNILVLNGVSQDEGAEAELLVLVKGPERENVKLKIASIDPAEGLEATLDDPQVTERLVRYKLIVRVPKGAPRMTRLGNDQGKLGRILLTTENSAIKEIPIEVKFSVN